MADGVLAGDSTGRICFVGTWGEFRAAVPGHPEVAKGAGIVCPPFLDAHIHIPQFPIRGKFAEGVEEVADGGRLLAGLQRNVFPAEALAAEAGYAAECVRQFREDTLSMGVVGGAAYMTVHARATEIALRELGELWSVGMVLMNQNCPEYLRTDEENVEQDLRKLGGEFGKRFIVTDRFAVAVNSDLRRRATRVAEEMGLRMQTHLNEQRAEKKFVEEVLYPGRTYTGVYGEDGLLGPGAILAHCIWMGEEEWGMVRDSGSVVAHCPTSNTLLGSGVMRLEEVKRRGIPYAICTDVGASPTTSMLCEMAEFLRAHAGVNPSATAEEALYRSTLAPAEILGVDREVGSFEVGKSMSFIEVGAAGVVMEQSAEEVIRMHLLGGPEAGTSAYGETRTKLAAEGLRAPSEMDALAGEVEGTIAKLGRKVMRVVVAGKEVWRREGAR